MMLYRTLFLVSLLTILVSCTTPTVASPGPPASGGIINIQNWPQGQTGQLIGINDPFTTTNISGQISASGKLLYYLFTPPESDLFRWMDGQPTDGCTGQAIAQPSEVKVFSFWAIGFGVKFDSTKQIGGGVLILNRNVPTDYYYKNLTTGDKLGLLVYANQDATIKGSETCPKSYPPYSIPSSNWNLNLKAGWNYMVLEVKSLENNLIHSIEWSSSVTLPKDMNWYYFPDTP